MGGAGVIGGGSGSFILLEGGVARLAFALALALIAVLFVCPCARLISSHLTPHECCSHPYSHIMIPFLVSWSISSVLHMNPMRNT